MIVDGWDNFDLGLNLQKQKQQKQSPADREEQQCWCGFHSCLQFHFLSLYHFHSIQSLKPILGFLSLPARGSSIPPFLSFPSSSSEFHFLSFVVTDLESDIFNKFISFSTFSS
ncbi:hypothetical protein RIF29_40943 [Crotalaria pallida]|uniref:Uncharacterized protein n=1 Tax=Crotalaria pallida TaxID=3830 RepID=A0AAN9E4F5_CROPI